MEETERDIIRVWEADGFRLEMWSTYRRDSRGQDYLGYIFSDKGEVIFQGEDFSGSPMHADDSDETVAGLLSFLSLRPGDTDAEYFESYTPRQLEWCQGGRAEELGVYVYDLENPAPVKIERVVFMQGDDAEEALAILDNDGIDAAIDHLKQWHNPGEHETSEETGAGSDDDTHETEDGYILTYNTRVGYIGLEYRARD